MKTTNTFDLAGMIRRMNQFSADDKNDAVSVCVARVAHKLTTLDRMNTQPLTPQDIRIIRMFEKQSA